MKCDCCPALNNDEGYEHSAEDWWCELGETEHEFKDGSCGCKRKSIEKIKADLKACREIENEAFADECGKMVDFFKNADIEQN